MDIKNYKKAKIKYIYLEFPKKEYYVVPHLDDRRVCDYIKPIGKDLVDFLNMDLEWYEDNLESLKNILLGERIPFHFKKRAFESFSISYAQENFIYLVYVHNPVVMEVNTILTNVYSGTDMRVPMSTFKRWYQRVYNYYDLQKNTESLSAIFSTWTKKDLSIITRQF